ncbi:MAG: DUF5658 family protein [Dehalococcoidia bacterium]
MLLPAWIGLNTADAILTGISFPLGAVEVNPYLAAMASTMSLERMLLIKILFAVAIGAAVWRRRAYRLLRLLNWAMVGVVLFNAFMITYAL